MPSSTIGPIQIWMLSPELSVVLLSFVVLGLDLVTRRKTAVWLTALIGLIIPTLLTFSLIYNTFGSHPRTAFYGMLVVDNYAIFFKLLFMAIGFGVILVSYQYVEKYLRATPGEYYSIILMSLAGMMLMGSTGELISVYISLELTSIPLYILAGLSRRDSRSAEAAVKYVLLGAMSSAILLYGMALLYGATGTTDLLEIAAATKNVLHTGNLLLLVAEVFIFAGFGFKISAVPFHMWAPDIYEGAPTPSTLFFSVGSKAAGFAALLRVFVFGGLTGANGTYLWVMVAIVAALTMTLGNVVAILQTNIKRMMAYSSIGQAGYLLIGFATLIIHNTVVGDEAMLAFLFVFVVTNIGAFTGVIALADATGKESIRDFDGFGRGSPLIAGGMALCLLALAGIPPMAGFLSKLFIFYAAWGQGSGMTLLVILGLVNSVISIVYYANIVYRMFVVEPAKREFFRIPGAVTATMAVSVVAILAITVVFGPLLTQAGIAAA
ncbi:MAG TPA: NADH-quinone oxidoreductase subunit N, partial [Ktedonobacterales bacterium]|nr:NADH-quinone oxidoreductase subunit N [Ktedonobacterales bacterium]